MDPIWVHHIVTHKQPHFDEATAIDLLKLYGAEVFHGIRDAKIVFWNAGSATPDGRSAAEWEADGYLLVGVGGGRFDEHPSKTGERKKDCAAMLVAKFLGIDQEPALQELLHYTQRTDTTAIKLPPADRELATFGIANLAKLVNRFSQMGDEKALEWMMVAVQAAYCDQLEYVHAKLDFAADATVIEVNLLGFPEPLKVSAIVSDNTKVAPLARSKDGNESAVVIQQNTKGQAYISVNTYKYPALRFFDAVRLVRMAEILAKNPSATLPSWNDLAKERSPEGVEEWFFMYSGQMLMNGSLTNPDARPTALSLTQLIELVKAGLHFSVSHTCKADCGCEFLQSSAMEQVRKILGL